MPLYLHIGRVKSVQPCLLCFRSHQMVYQTLCKRSTCCDASYEADGASSLELAIARGGSGTQRSSTHLL